MMKFSLCIPTFNRVNYLFESFSDVIHDERINEVIIMDDCSPINIFSIIENKVKESNNEKIKLFRQEINLGAFNNKVSVVKKAINEYVILLDSDNKITLDYLDNIPQTLDENTIYAPVQAICESNDLNYEKHKGSIFCVNDFKYHTILGDKSTQCLFNTGNFIFNKLKYLEVVELEGNVDNCFAVDVFYFLYLWFKNNNKSTFVVVENLRYYHRLHKSNMEESSHYLKTYSDSELFLEYLKKRIDEL